MNSSTFVLCAIQGGEQRVGAIVAGRVKGTRRVVDATRRRGRRDLDTMSGATKKDSSRSRSENMK